jgi:hypothetical protein
VKLDKSWGQRHLGTDAVDTHTIVSQLMFGGKSRLLIALLKRSTHKKKPDLLEALKKIQAAKRDTFAHAYLALDKNSVLFIERTKGGDYKVIEHPFTSQEFRQHVADFIRAAQKFQDALDPDGVELLEFVKAADPKALQSPTTSPQDPADKK